MQIFILFVLKEHVHLETKFLNRYLIFDFPADLLQRLLLGLGEGQFGGDRVAFGHQRAALLFGQDQRARAL